MLCIDEIEHEQRAHAVVGEAFPHLGGKEQAEPAGMSEERAVGKDVGVCGVGHGKVELESEVRTVKTSGTVRLPASGDYDFAFADMIGIDGTAARSALVYGSRGSA